ncbi:MAG: 2,3,4,5-tetrahydropyridine-2,6-dicarboxylate N-succinyltransferase [Flavobacteriales bacterium TMED191]|nr:MAG: 2,3,4,5-tetrahydropyridine-2,6-dicarboxylate N-succinyltransferase [Flavobacteriales bacterium TMED191]
MDKIKNQDVLKTCQETVNLVYSQEKIDLKHHKWIQKTITLIENGKIRVAKKQNNKWIINEWVKKAILLYFKIQEIQTIEIGPFEFHDKIPLKKDFKNKHIRVVPHAIVRYGSFVNKNVVLMPSYVNIGAYIDSGTMIDTWATIGSCAQIGKNVHISGGVGIGGVLEPIQSSPVIIEDNCFIGSRCIIVEGVKINKEAVIGAGVILTSSTKIIDVSGSKKVYYHAEIPERSVVIPGTYKKDFKAGEFSVPCALIIGKRKESTNKKTSLNAVLRDFEIST